MDEWIKRQAGGECFLQDELATGKSPEPAGRNACSTFGSVAFWLKLYMKRFKYHWLAIDWRLNLF